MTDFYCPSCKTSWNGRYNTTHRCDTCNTPVRVKTAAPEATWISVEDRLPAEPSSGITFEQHDFIVTDGLTVGVCDFQRGHGCGTPWAEWGGVWVYSAGPNHPLDATTGAAGR